MGKKNKQYWAAYHLKSLDYFKKQFEKKISKKPSKSEILNLGERELRDLIRTIKEDFRWYRNGVVQHRKKAHGHLERETDWLAKMEKLESDTDDRLAIIPHGVNMSKLDVPKLRETALDLLVIVNQYKETVEEIRLKALQEFGDSDKLSWALEKRGKENQSLENLFVTGNEFNKRYCDDFKTAHDVLKKGDMCIKKSRDPKIQAEVGKLSKNKLDEMLNNPEKVGTIIDEFFPEIFKTCGFDLDEFGTIFNNVDSEKKQKIVGLIANLRMMFLMQVVKDVDNDISIKIGELFDSCEKKDRNRLEKIFEKPRLDFLRKFVASFKKSWRLIDEKDLDGEPILDNRVRMIKTFSEGIYKELLIVIQEMMQIAYGYRSTTAFGNIINQIEKAPDNLNLLVNRIVYDIRNSESHENIDYEKGEKAQLYDNKGKLLRELTIEELDKNFKWISEFVNSTFYTLQVKYLDMIGVGHSQDEKMQYVAQVLFPKILQDFLIMK